LSFDDREVFVDPNPVPAVSELREGGLAHVPATRLIGGFTRRRDDWVVRGD
jgi:hypothetical protein